VFGVILNGVARAGMREYRQTFSVFQQPRDDAPEELRLKRKLTAASWMRADRIVMHPPNDNRKGFPGCLAQGLCLLPAARIKIDVRVVFTDGTHVALLASTTLFGSSLRMRHVQA
jgi:hypothetical protein